MIPSIHGRAPIEVTAAIIREGERVLITQRSAGHLAGKWEFPGGKVEGDEELVTCLEREIEEELGISISVTEPFHSVVHDYGEQGVIRLHSFICGLVRGEPKARSHTNLKWVTIDEIASYDFAPADIPIVARLISRGIK